MYKIMIAEDDATVRKGIVLKTDWNRLGCMVAGEASNGEEGLDLARRIRPDIIITDIQMPKMDGIEMLSTLQKEGCTAKMIILTAYSDFNYAQSAIRIGVCDYLLKPLKDGDIEELILRITEQNGETDGADAAEAPILKFNETYSPHSKVKYVEEALSYLADHYAEDINISTVSAFLELSEGYLSRVIKKETSYTFTEYLTLFRIKKAMEQLKNPSVKVYEVADRCGYHDTAYFSVQFKKLTGMSPSEYQDRCR